MGEAGAPRSRSFRSTSRRGAELSGRDQKRALVRRTRGGVPTVPPTDCVTLGR